MPCPLGAVDATSRRWHKLRVALVERSEFQDEQDVRLNPELQIADGEQDAFGLLPSRAPILFEASGERLFLLVGLELRQQERMADADLLAVEGFDHDGRKLGQLQAEPRHTAGFLPVFAAICSMEYFGSSKLRRARKPLRFFHRVNVAALEVFNQLRLQRFGIGEVDDADGHGRGFGHLRGAETPRSGDDLEARSRERPHQQGRENALGADAFGQFLQGVVLEDAARVGLGLGEQRERKVAVLGGIDDGGFHGDELLSSG